MEQHCKNIEVIIDSLKLKIELLKFTAQNFYDLTLEKAKERFDSI